MDDNSNEEVVDLEPDEPPKNGDWVDHENFFDNLTPEEEAAGNKMGEVVDTEDDDDDGMYVIKKEVDG